MFGWVILTSLFVGLGTMFAPGKLSYRVRRIIDKGKRLTGMQTGIASTK